MAGDAPKGGIFERMAHGYFYGDNQYAKHSYDEELSAEEWASLRKIRIKTLLFSALAGTLGVLLLYLPPHFWPDFFTLWTFHPVIFGTEIEFPLFATLYGIVLAVAEIWFLVVINIRAVHAMAKVCSFPPKNDPDRDEHIRSLVNIGTEKNAKNELNIGLDPHQGYSKYRLMMIFIWNKVKASLSNVVFKMLVRKILGRYAVRVVVDLAGVPVMATWNAIAANGVLRHAKVRILAPNVIQYTALYLHKKYSNDEIFRNLLYDILQYLAIKKRSFHENHYLLSVNLLKTFRITTKEKHHLDEKTFLQTLLQLPEEMRQDISKLMVVGMMLDGHLSLLEKKSIREMNEKGICKTNVDELKKIMAEFVNGKGIGILKDKLEMTGVMNNSKAIV
ncbi:MAG: LBF_2804 family protein [Bacteroidota bacterium]